MIKRIILRVFDRVLTLLTIELIEMHIFSFDPIHFIGNMILDHQQFAHRLFTTILHHGDRYAMEILLLKSSRLNINLNDLEYNGQSLIHLCCLYNRLDLLKLFLQYGPYDLFRTNRDGWLPMHIAVYLGHMEIVVYLLEHLKLSRWFFHSDCQSN